MAKYFKTKLNISSKKTLTTLKSLAGAYRKIYNNCLDSQLYLFHYGVQKNKQFLSGTDLLKLVREACKKDLSFTKTIDSGIISAATFKANETFTRWAKMYLHYSDYKFRVQPKFLSRKRGNLKFKTNNVKVFYDYITIPKFGKIKLFEKGYIPQGKKYSDVTFSFDGNNWWISLKVEEPSTKQELTNSKVILDFNAEGELIVNGSTISLSDIPNLTKLQAKQKKLAKKIRRQALNNITEDARRTVRTSRNMMKTRKALLVVKNKIKNIKTDKFKKIANEVAKTKPSELHLFSPFLIDYLANTRLKTSSLKADVLKVLSITRKKLESIGTSVVRHTSPEFLAP